MNSNSYIFSRNFNIIYIDMVHKTNPNKQLFIRKNSSTCAKFIKSRVSVIFEDYKPSVNFANSVNGLFLQLFKVKTNFYKSVFGFKSNKYTYYIFSVLNSNLSDISGFFLFMPDNLVGKLVFTGFYGKHFKYIRFVIPDIFNFFGSSYFSGFYLDYFDWKGQFVVDLLFSTDNMWFKLGRKNYFNFQYNLLSLFKLLSSK